MTEPVLPEHLLPEYVSWTAERLHHRIWLFCMAVSEKMVDAFSLKLQRDYRQNALSVDPAKGKLEKKAAFPPHCGDETTTNYNQSLLYSEHANNTTLLYHYPFGELQIKAFC